MRAVVFFMIGFLSHGLVYGQDSDSLFYEEEDLESIESDDYAEYEYETEPAPHGLIPADELETTRAYRSGTLVLRPFDPSKWEQVVGDMDYNEVPDEDEAEDDAMNDWPAIPWGGPLLKLIAYIFITALVLLLVYLVIRNISFGQRITRAEIQVDDLSAAVANIEEVDIQGLLDQARAEGNFRAAVRLYYLGLLKKLHALNVISWKKDKTNRDYLAELSARDYHFEDIRSLTNAYEAVWYGDHALGAESFQRLAVQFETVYRKVSNPPTS